MKYLSRNKIYEKVKAIKSSKKVYIFCEGDTEVKYFKFFQGFASNIDIIAISNENGKSDPVKLKENAIQIFEGSDDKPPKYILSSDSDQQDEVWFVIDTDRWNEGNKIQELKDYCLVKNKESESWFVAQSNPSFELWFYYHFYDKKPNKEEVQEFNTFKKFVGDKILGGFDSRSMPVELKKTITNSEINFKLDSNNSQPSIFSTSVHNLGKVILSFTNEQLEKCLKHNISHNKKNT